VARNQKGWKLQDPESKECFVYRHVIFHETTFTRGPNQPSQSIDLADLLEANDAPDAAISGNGSDADDSSAVNHEQAEEQHPGADAEESDGPADVEASVGVDLRRSSRVRRPVQPYWLVQARDEGEAEEVAMAVTHRQGAQLKAIDVPVPQTVKEALNGAHAKQWREAMHREFKSLIRNGTWRPESCPPGRNAIASKWVFKVKPNSEGFVDSFKARLVIRGFTQRYGVDYLETFSPVAKATSIRTILALAALHRKKLRHVDFETAYLNGTLEEEIWMTLPQDSCFLFASSRDQAAEDWTVRLLKGLYGLKQSGRLWNRQIDALLRKIGFKRSQADPCLYIKTYDNNERMILGLYVDDCLIAYDQEWQMKEVLDQLKEVYALKDLGQPTQILGIQVESFENGDVKIHQARYIEELLVRFGMDDCNESPIPQAPSLFLTQDMSPSTEADREAMKKVPYAELVGSLNWLATSARPDIAQTVSKLCRFVSNPGPEHWKAGKQVLRYLKGTKSYGLRYRHDGNRELLGYQDSDWAGDKDTRRSTSGFGFALAGALVSWRSKLQTSVALSSTEAEYMACCFATREAVWLRRLLMETGLQVAGPTILHEDNSGCVSLSGNWRADQRTKHIDVQYHFVREQVEAKTVQLKRVATNKMVADALTKPVPRPKFEWCREHFGMEE
jgi:hypothetical protein